jgi:hypothetical protein
MLNFLSVLVDSFSQGRLVDIVLCALIVANVFVICIVDFRLIESAACLPVGIYGMKGRLLFGVTLEHVIFPQQQVLLMSQMFLLQSFLILVLFL